MNETHPLVGAMLVVAPVCHDWVFSEFCYLELQPKVGGKLHIRLKSCTISIANNYCKGKLKRTLNNLTWCCLKSNNMLKLIFVT